MSANSKTALVTGAARGIGLAIASRLAADGARVAVLDIDAKAAEAAAKKVGGGALSISADVTKAADVDAAIQRVIATWGKLDILVNNAGITGRSFPIQELSDEDWSRVIAADLTSVFLCCRAAIKVMLGQGSGRIIRAEHGGPAHREDSDGEGRSTGRSRCAGCVARLRRLLLHDGRGARPLRRPRDLLALGATSLWEAALWGPAAWTRTADRLASS
jgi:nucleoside-diphosphate-sugar epimerase